MKTLVILLGSLALKGPQALPLCQIAHVHLGWYMPFGVGIGPVTTALSVAAVIVAWLFFIPLGLMVEQEDTHSGSQEHHLNKWHVIDLVIGMCHVS